MFKLKLRTDTALGRFRSVLLLVLVVTVAISALVAIFGVVSDAFGDALWRVVSTSSLLAVLSFAVLLQTFSLPRARLVDRANSAVGIPAAIGSGFIAFDSLYEWRLMDTWFGGDQGGRVTSTVVSLALAAAGFGLLLSVNKSARSVRSALVTGGLVWVLWLFNFLNTWFPRLFNRLVEEKWGEYWEMHPFWQKFVSVIGILLGAMAVVTFVLELIGVAHARREAEGLTRLVGIDVQLPPDVRELVAAGAANAGVSEAEFIASLVAASVRP